MSPERGPGERRLPEHGVVEDFFAEERAEVPDLPGHDLHWRGIVRQAGRRGRRGPGRLLAAAAAVGVLAAGGGLAWQTIGGGDGAGPDSAARPAAGARTPPHVEISGRQQVLAFTAQGDDSRSVLVSADCDGRAACPVVWSTDDDGRTWGPRALPELGTTPPDGIATGPGQVALLRFGADGRGWLAGSTMQRTEDGGRTWSDFPYPGGTVLAMEADRDGVRIVAGDSCDDDGCSGRLRVYPAEGDARRADRVTLDRDLGHYRDVDLTTARQSAYLSVDTDDGPRVWRLDGRRARELAVCPDASSVDLAVPADGSEAITAVCGTRVGDETRVEVATSRDEGRSWTRPDGGTRLPGVPVDVTAPNGDAIVVATDSSGGAGIHRSTDEGASWTDANGARGPWRWVAAGGAGRVYAISADGRLHQSRDGGETWQRVRLD